MRMNSVTLTKHRKLSLTSMYVCQFSFTEYRSEYKFFNSQIFFSVSSKTLLNQHLWCTQIYTPYMLFSTVSDLFKWLYTGVIYCFHVPTYWTNLKLSIKDKGLHHWPPTSMGMGFSSFNCHGRPCWRTEDMFPYFLRNCWWGKNLKMDIKKWDLQTWTSKLKEPLHLKHRSIFFIYFFWK